MAHFAKLGVGNKVLSVVVVHNDIATTEQAGRDFLNNLYDNDNDIWVQTSYNTRQGVHLLGGTPLRKNYAGIGYTYDHVRDAFIPPKSYPSFIFDEDKADWVAPIAYPDDGKDYKWDEETVNWILR